MVRPTNITATALIRKYLVAESPNWGRTYQKDPKVKKMTHKLFLSFHRNHCHTPRPKGWETQSAFTSALGVPILFFRIIRQVFLSSEFNYVVSHKTNTTSQHNLLSTALMKNIVEKKPREQKLRTASWEATGISVYWWEADGHNSSGEMLALPSETEVCMVFMISGGNRLLCVHMVETL